MSKAKSTREVKKARQIVPLLITAILSIALLVYLGFWQLQRAEEKSEILLQAKIYQNQPPISWAPSMVEPKPHQSIKVEGRALHQTLLLDNQYHQHQLGFHVISLVQVDGGKIVLVDRGWIAADPSRVHFPVISSKHLQEKFIGQVYYPSNKGFVLGEVFEKKAKHVILVEKLDVQLISHFLQKPIYPFIIRLGETEPNGFVRQWQSWQISMPPERHKAYALQWFVMAFILLIIFIGLYKKREK